MSATIGRWRSNCVGDFSGGSIYIATRFGGEMGDYAIAMYMSSDSSVLFGRGLMGEPKKCGRGSLYRDGWRRTGYVERGGARLIELSVTCTVESTVERLSPRRFNVKATPHHSGFGLQEDPIVVQSDYDVRVHSLCEGEGEIRLSGTPHDPLDEIEVVSVLGGTFLEGEQQCVNREAGRIAASEYLPYHYGRDGDDWSALDTASP